MAPWKHILILTSIIIFAVSYYMVDRIMLRATQLAANEFNPDYQPKSWIYAGTITAVWAVIFIFFIKDSNKKDLDENL